MRLLKKASIYDILKEDSDNVTIHYKEIELYVSLKDIEEFDNRLDELIMRLYKNNAIILAIHCPESRYKTSNDKNHPNSSNYLSICEAMKDEESKKNLMKVKDFAENIYIKQWKTGIDINEDEIELDDEPALTVEAHRTRKREHDKILLIVHSGCEIGCQKNIEGKNCTGTAFDSSLIEELKLENVQIVIENITPYFDENDSAFDKGQNCGWSNAESWNCFELAEKLDVGVCVDICHILASHFIINNLNNYSYAIDEYSMYIKEKHFQSRVSLFHLSNYGEIGKHGAQFDDTDSDNELLDKIMNFCIEIAPNVPATLEVADGQDYERACKNFDRLMLKLSEQHTRGLLGAILSNDINKDLKQYFDDLYHSYASDGNDLFELRERATRIKKYIISNTYINRELSQFNPPFNFSRELNKYETAMFRMQAYVYYTRFCNLAVFLAKYYDKNSIIDESDRAEDFALSLKYFMFNDDVKQIEYTGLAFLFNVDWLPRYDTIFRFFDDINDSQFDKTLKDSPMKFIMEKIRGHIEGTCCFFSCGRNFGACLFKYGEPSDTSKPNSWTVRVYEGIPVNFFEYKKRKYSIQAFLQLTANREVDFKDIDNFSFDMSRFHEGRGDEKSNEKNASSLYSLFRYYTNSISSVEKTASISDGEVIFLQLPYDNIEYALNEKSFIILLKAYVNHQSSSGEVQNLNIVADNLNKLSFDSNGLNITDANCMKLKKIQTQDATQKDIGAIEQLLTKVNKKEKNTKNGLLELSPYRQNPILGLFKLIENRL